MIVTIHQPEHMPWLGFVHKASMADVFVLLDTVQFRKNYFQNRNKVLTANGPAWITVPVAKHSLDTPIKNIEINHAVSWHKNYLKTIYFNYVRSPFFNIYMPQVEALLSERHEYLLVLNTGIIQWILSQFRIDVKIIHASDLGEIDLRRDHLLLEICKRLGAEAYVSGISGKTYLNEHLFMEKGIDIEYQSFYHPIYTQLHGGFVHGMSSLDLLFNYGEAIRKILLD